MNPIISVIFDFFALLSANTLIQTIVGNVLSALLVYAVLNHPIQKILDKNAKQKYISALVAELLVNFSLTIFIISAIEKRKHEEHILSSYKYQTTALKEAIFKENFSIDFHVRLTMLLNLFENFNKNCKNEIINKENYEEFLKEICRNAYAIKEAIKVIFKEVINSTISKFKIDLLPIQEQTFQDIEKLMNTLPQSSVWFGQIVEDIKHTPDLEP